MTPHRPFHLLPRLLPAAALSLALLPAAAAFGQAKQIALNAPVGTQIQFAETTGLNFDMQMNLGGQQMNVQQQIANREAGTMEVLEADGGRPTKVRVTFAPDSGASVESNGQSQKSPFPLAGQTVTITAAAGDSVTVEPDPGLDPAVKKELRDYLTLGGGLLPEEPIGPGDSWKPDPDAMGEAMPGITPETTLTLGQFATRDGREVAEVTAKVQAQGEMQGANMNVTANGPMVFDVATGVLLSSDIAGDIKMSGTVEQQGMTVQIDGGGKLTQQSRNTLTSAGGGAAATLQPPAGGAAATPQTPVPPATPDAPAVGSTEPADLYTDGTLAVAVRGDTLTLTRGGDSYPGTVASRNGQSLSGTFTASGTAFPYTATLAGDTLTFETGGATYTLKKQGATSPTPANPFGGN